MNNEKAKTLLENVFENPNSDDIRIKKAWMQPSIKLDPNVWDINNVKSQFGEFVSKHKDTNDEYLVNPKYIFWMEVVVRELKRIGFNNIRALRGKGGSGKSFHSINSAIKHADGKKPRMIFIASASNVSVKNLKNEVLKRNISDWDTRVKTFHSWFDLANKNGGFEGFPEWWPTPPEASSSKRLYIFDEVFFLDARTAALSLMCVPTGARLIVTGDEDQNRPVDQSEPWYWIMREVFAEVGTDKTTDPAKFLDFNAEPLAVGKIPCLVLTTDHRAVGDDLKTVPMFLFQNRIWPNVQALDCGKWPMLQDGEKFDKSGLREGVCEDFDHLFDRVRARIDDGFHIIVPTNALALKLAGNYNRLRDKGVMNSGWVGPISHKDEKARRNLYFRRGDEVMIRTNGQNLAHHRLGVYNGMVGTYWTYDETRGFHTVKIKTKNGNEATVHLLFNDKNLRTYSQIMEQEWEACGGDIDADELVDAAIATRQADSIAGLICHPKIITCHLAQGCSLDKVMVVIPPWIGPWMNSEWLYVALSRGRYAAEVCFVRNNKTNKEGKKVDWKEFINEQKNVLLNRRVRAHDCMLSDMIKK